MSKTHRNTKTEKKALKSLIKFKEGSFGPEDGSLKPKKNRTWLRKAVLAEDLRETYVKDKNSL